MFADLPLYFINRLLGAEPWAAELLRPHVGQTALVELAGLRLRFTVGDDLRLHAASTEASDTVSLRVAAEALPDLLDGPGALTQHAHIEGNAAFAETLAKLLQHLRPDLAGHLAPWLGDALASRVARSSQSFGSAALATGRKLGESATNLIRDEARLVVQRTEQADFQLELDELLGRISSFEQKLASARSTVQSGSGN